MTDFSARMSRRIRDFLLSQKSREFFLFLFFFVVASGFWLLQTLDGDYEREFTIPLRLKGVPDDVVVTGEPVSEVHVRVRDKGTVLLNYMLGKSFYPLVLEYDDYRKVGNHVRIPSLTLDKKIRSQFNASTALLSVKPDTLEYYVAVGTSKRVPVRLRGEVSAERLHYLSDTIFSPDSVQVYAMKSVLDTIHAAYTQPVTFRNIGDTLRQQIVLATEKGVKFVPSFVQLTLPVDIYMEKTVEVPLTGINFPAGKVLRTFPSKVQITFKVGGSRFRQITADDFHLYVSYEELLRLGTEPYTLTMPNPPAGVSQVRFSPAQVDFLIEQLSGDAG